MQKTKILYFITRMDQGGAQASVLLTLKNINKQQYTQKFNNEIKQKHKK